MSTPESDSIFPPVFTGNAALELTPGQPAGDVPPSAAEPAPEQPIVTYDPTGRIGRLQRLQVYTEAVAIGTRFKGLVAAVREGTERAADDIFTEEMPSGVSDGHYLPDLARQTDDALEQAERDARKILGDGLPPICQAVADSGAVPRHRDGFLPEPGSVALLVYERHSTDRDGQPLPPEKVAANWQNRTHRIAGLVAMGTIECAVSEQTEVPPPPDDVASNVGVRGAYQQLKASHTTIRALQELAERAPEQEAELAGRLARHTMLQEELGLQIDYARANPDSSRFFEDGDDNSIVARVLAGLQRL